MDGTYKIKRSVKTPLFFCLSCKAQKIAFNGFYLFGGGIIPTATRERNATPRTAQFFGYSRRFLGSVVFSAGWNGSKRLQAIFDGFTVDGLKARNGSRTRSGCRAHKSQTYYIIYIKYFKYFAPTHAHAPLRTHAREICCICCRQLL